MIFSARIDFAPARNSLDLERESLRAKGSAFFDLSQSNPTKVGLGFETDRITRAFANQANALYYPDPKGLANARRASPSISLRKGRISNVDPERFLLSPRLDLFYLFSFSEPRG
jgi:hypothetical protein